MRLKLTPVRLTATLFAILLLPLLAYGTVARGATLPPNFTDSLVTNIPSPTDLAFTPDGRMLITTQGGQLRVIKGGAMQPITLDISGKVCSDFERGLLGVSVDPAFASNRYIYVYYTFKKNGGCERNSANSPVNRVSRFTLPDSNVIDPASELVLIDNIHSPNGNHNAGDLDFGKDGFLYVSVGDGGCDYAGDSGCAGANDSAKDMHVMVGKMLRITNTGAIPSTNPHRGSDSARCNVTGSTDKGKKCQEIFSTGLRNPFRIAFDPNASGTRFFINDVGQNAWEEINEGKAGADYGWNTREGNCVNGSTSNCGAPPAGLTNPVHAYNRSAGCASITGGAFVPNNAWPSEFNNSYLFADYVCGKIFKLTPNGSGGYTASDFITGLGNSSAVAMTFGPSEGGQALYYTTYAGGGQVRRVTAPGSANRAPVADIKANPTSGAAPLAVTFNGSGSTDPDGDALTYIWNFGDGSANRETTTPTTSYTYNTSNAFNATLRVRDAKGALSNPATLRIDVGNTPPQATITAPKTTDQYGVGQTITLTGAATDAQDGNLPNTALSWRVTIHHADHTHPFLAPTTGNNLTFAAPGPEDLAATTNSYLSIELTATDSKGLKTVVTQELRPKLVDVTLATDPPGLKVEVNGFTFTGPQKITSWPGYALNVKAPSPQTNATGQTMTFASWSDGGAASHTITTPASAATYTAKFNASGGGGGTGGLQAIYFDNIDFTAQKITRTDATVNFDWSNGSPDPQIGADSFSARWTGQVTPRFSENYTFYTVSDDGVRLWIDGKLVIDNWTDHAPTENNGVIALKAGQKYDIRMEYYENGGGAVAKLLWSSPSQAKEVIPQSQLTPTSGSVTTGPTISQIKGVQEGQSLAGTAVIEAVVSGQSIAQVNFQLTGPKAVSLVERFAPYVFFGDRDGTPIGWNTKTYPNGDYTLTVTATDTAGKAGTRTVKFKIANGGQPTPQATVPPPSGKMIAEVKGVTAGQTLSGRAVIQAMVSDPTVTQVAFKVDGPKGATWTEKNDPYFLMGNNGPQPFGWQTAEHPNGDYTLTVTATNAAGQTDVQTVKFKIAN
jgi:glucose/arabinose dehydrogenase